jgi:hypothetical protein
MDITGSEPPPGTPPLRGGDITPVKEIGSGKCFARLAFMPIELRLDDYAKLIDYRIGPMKGASGMAGDLSSGDFDRERLREAIAGVQSCQSSSVAISTTAAPRRKCQ